MLINIFILQTFDANGKTFGMKYNASVGDNNKKMTIPGPGHYSQAKL